MSAPRALRSVGIKQFVANYAIFKTQNRARIISFLVDNGISNESGAAIRASYAIQIMSNKGLLTTCLKYIIDSQRTTSQVREAAKALLDTETKK